MVFQNASAALCQDFRVFVLWKFGCTAISLFALVSRVEPNYCTMALKVLVIGAGAGGLVTLKTLLEASERDPLHPISPLLVEAEEGLGGTFRVSDHRRKYEHCS